MSPNGFLTFQCLTLFQDCIVLIIRKNTVTVSQYIQNKTMTHNNIRIVHIICKYNKELTLIIHYPLFAKTMSSDIVRKFGFHYIFLSHKSPSNLIYTSSLVSDTLQSQTRDSSRTGVWLKHIHIVFFLIILEFVDVARIQDTKQVRFTKWRQ